MLLNIEQRKGDPDNLDGRVTVYAVIDLDRSDLASTNHPIASMIHNGFLVAQGNYREQSSLKDFLKSEMGISMDEGLGEGLAQLLEKMDGIESALDPQKLKDRLENMEGLEEFIPTPAKIVPFHSEQEILDQDGDVFYAGVFRNIGNAVLSINAMPILYQARFRELELRKIRSEIETLISQIERNEGPSSVPSITDSGLDVEQKILREFIPNMLYCRKDEKLFDAAQKQFRLFMGRYRFKEDTESIIGILGSPQDLTAKHFRILELYARKISSVQKEDFGAAEATKKEIEQLRSEL